MIEEAIKVARRSTVRTHKTGAVIFDRRGKIISRGWSHHPNNRRRLKETPWSTHAEMHAILRAPVGHLSGCYIAVATLSRAGNITLAKPCDCCERILEHVGIFTHIYTIKGDKHGE